MSLYRNFFSQEEIDANYRTDIGLDLPGLMRRYATESARVREELPCRLGLKYGPTRAESLDLFAGSAGAPVLVFIHGGYWRLGSAGDFSVLASGPVAHGVAVAVTDYALCPTVTIDEITRQSRAAVAWLWHNARDLGIDRDRIFIAGHSAGGQQVGMLLDTDWPGQYELPADVVKGALAISGVSISGHCAIAGCSPSSNSPPRRSNGRVRFSTCLPRRRPWSSPAAAPSPRSSFARATSTSRHGSAPASPAVSSTSRAPIISSRSRAWPIPRAC